MQNGKMHFITIITIQVIKMLGNKGLTVLDIMKMTQFPPHNDKKCGNE